MSNDLADLLDAVENTPGWRVQKLDSSRWRVYPPKPADIIHVSDSGDHRALKNTQALLRRAGWEELKLQTSKGNGQMPAVSAPSGVVSVHASPIDAIRADVDVMLGCLTRISDNLKLVEKEREGIAQLKQLLGTVLK